MIIFDCYRVFRWKWVSSEYPSVLELSDDREVDARVDGREVVVVGLKDRHAGAGRRKREFDLNKRK